MIRGTHLFAATLLLLVAPSYQPAAGADSIPFKGLQAPARILTDRDAVPHIFAANHRDAMLLLGYAHARDRFFQMDLLRHQASGTSAELAGTAALSADVQLRTFGLRRSAEASLPLYPPETLALIEGYAAGVNAWLDDPSSALPPEYAALELTKASVARWTPLDSVAIAKLLCFQLSFDTSDIDSTAALAAYQAAGKAGGFDGTALMFEDVRRSSPFDPVASAKPGVTASAAKPAAALWSNPAVEYSPELVRLAEKYSQTLRAANLFTGTLAEGDPAGSNWILVGGGLTASGKPMIANDPHLSLSTPPVWYEAHLAVENDPQKGPMNVTGVTFAGIPGVILGCNERACWGATVNPMDVTDVYQERLVLNPATLSAGTVYDNAVEPVVVLPQTFKANQVGNRTLNDLVTVNVSPLQGGLTLIVPRRNNGPIVAMDATDPLNVTALSIQFAGWGPTRELQAFLDMGRAGSPDQFRAALQSFSFGSENFGYADVDGNIAYFAGGELPLREDLQKSGRADGAPPYLIRDGTHAHKNEWMPASSKRTGQVLPYEILPTVEMPQLVNPAAGFIVSANNDPSGTNAGNDPLSQQRTGGGVYYLGRGFDQGQRAATLTRLMQWVRDSHLKVDYHRLAAIQGNNEMLDAQVFVPYITAALRNARSATAPPALAELANDAKLAESINRLSDWRGNTPTGLKEGFDPAKDAANPSGPSEQEVRDSVAATVYSVWRAQFLQSTIDATLEKAGLGKYLPADDVSLASLRYMLDRFAVNRGKGASGLNFFAVDGVASPDAARDIIILRSMRGALEQLSGAAYAAAFNRSTDLNDYRWGKLHRIVFRHVLGAPFSIPTASGFTNLSSELPGLARAGGYSVPDASPHKLRAKAPADFMFSSGPSRRFIGEMLPEGVRAFEMLPGGQSGVFGAPHYASMLGRWLTNFYHPLALAEREVETSRLESFIP